MPLSEAEREFLEKHHSALMITVARSGIPRVARVGVALVGGRLWSSGTVSRVRTARLRRDPRCSVCVLGPGPSWVTLETRVTILEGADAARQNLELFRVMQGRPTGSLNWYGEELEEGNFLSTMAADHRLIYQFEVDRVYGAY
ncbi:MAG: pyridoxamine 5'-phosphate oxidase family protein [Candidatus Dormibacteria bacterium]